MKITLTREQVMKILSVTPLDNLRDYLDYNWKIWDVNIVEEGFELFAHVDKEKLK